MAAHAIEKTAGSHLPALPPDAPIRSTRTEHPSLYHISRLAAALAPDSVARLYLGDNGRLELVARHPPSRDEIQDDAGARAAASGAVRSERPTTTDITATVESGRTESSSPAASHLAVPVPGADGRRGALVVSGSAGRSWQDEERAALTDLVAVGSSGIHGFTGGALQVPAHGREARIGRNGSEPAAIWSPPRANTDDPPGPAELFAGAGDDGLVEIIRDSIVGSLHLGALHTGDRLPSIRQTARAFSVTPYMVLQAYAELELEGLVERRKRSGIFVAAFEVAPRPELPETGEWLAEVLTQACLHQVKIPLLPDLIRRWTSTTTVRCLCVESCEDSRYTLALELSQQFGMETVPVPLAGAVGEIERSDLLISTAYHAADLAPLAADTGIPMLVATVSPAILSAALSHLRRRDLTVVCVDREYGERLRSLQGGVYRDRVRVVTVAEIDAIEALDRTEPVLLTPAARDRLGRQDFRLVAPMHPSYSLDFARQVSEALVRINLAAGRAAFRDGGL